MESSRDLMAPIALVFSVAHTYCITVLLAICVTLELITNLLKADELDDEELSGKAHKDYCRISSKVK